MVDSLDIFHFCMILVHLWIKLAGLIYKATLSVCEYIISCANPKCIAVRYFQALNYFGECAGTVLRTNCKVVLANFDAVCPPDSSIRVFCDRVASILGILRTACMKMYETVN